MYWKGEIGYLVVDKTQLFGNEELCQKACFTIAALTLSYSMSFSFTKGHLSWEECAEYVTFYYLPI